MAFGFGKSLKKFVKNPVKWTKRLPDRLWQGVENVINDTSGAVGNLLGYNRDGGSDYTAPTEDSPSYLSTSSYSATTDSAQNADNLRRRAGRSFATGGGALGSGSIATSGIRNTLG